MAKESNDIRNKTRLVKNHILNRYLKLANIIDEGGYIEGDDKPFYNDLTMKFANNVVPRSVEVAGEDGEPINISFDKTFLNASNPTSETTGDNTQSS